MAYVFRSLFARWVGGSLIPPNPALYANLDASADVTEVTSAVFAEETTSVALAEETTTTMEG